METSDLTEWGDWEVLVHTQNYYLIWMSETWWNSLHDSSGAMDSRNSGRAAWIKRRWYCLRH